VPNVEPDVEPNAPPKRAVWFRYTDAASVGIEMVVAIVVCALGALWLERNVTHWSPWTSLIGIGIGLGAAAKAVMRAARSYRRQLAESADRDISRPS
jgi:F0F1-type ATP synthase assembly protein I